MERKPRVEVVSRRIRQTIRAIPDFPKPGILFQDLTPVMADGALFTEVIEMMAAGLPRDIEGILGIEARGFIFGAAVAHRLGVGFYPARKPGKLPGVAEGVSYDLEYGTDGLELHTGSFPRGARVAIVDDVLATGGTAAAAGALTRKLGGEVVGWTFVLEIAALGGSARLSGAPISILTAV